MSQKRAIAFIPEFNLTSAISRKVKLTENIYLLPQKNKLVLNIKKEIETKGYEISGGSFLYFEGALKGDGTLYEIFQGYSLALTFFNPKGRATCRAIKDLENKKEDVHLFIDEYDKFGYEQEDIILLSLTKIKKIRPIYSRIEAQLENKDFNPLRNSLEFFILFLSEKQIRTRLLYLSICLESILLEGDSEGISYKLGIRCANFLNRFYTRVNMNDVFIELKNSYALRSKIIHGDDYKKASEKIIKKGRASTELNHVHNLESIVKEVFSAVFIDKNCYEDSIAGKLGESIDQKYILNH